MAQPPKLEVKDLTGDEMGTIIEGILEVLYPGGGLEHEHGADELGAIVQILESYHLVH